MANFKVFIYEELATNVDVEAKDIDEAVSKVKEMYKNCEIVLSGDDFASVDFRAEDEE